MTGAVNLRATSEISSVTWQEYIDNQQSKHWLRGGNLKIVIQTL